MNMNRSEMDEAQIRAIEEHQISQGLEIGLSLQSAWSLNWFTNSSVDLWVYYKPLWGVTLKSWSR